jgi:hypothetical protein
MLLKFLAKPLLVTVALSRSLRPLLIGFVQPTRAVVVPTPDFALGILNPSTNQILIVQILLRSFSDTLRRIQALPLPFNLYLGLPRKHNGPVWDVLTTPTERGNWWRHPGPKPVALMEQLCGFVPQGGTILDPFCGSGSNITSR